jgi:Core-2/I-Branching enzyme
MKICYFILLHHKFDQAKRLISRLNCPQASFIIHIDAKVSQEVFERFKDDISHIKTVQFLDNRVDAKWGSFDLTLAMLRMIEYAVDNNIDANRFMLISGQDYPILSNSKIVEFLENHPHEEFMEYHSMDIDDKNAQGWSPYYRFRRYHFWIGRKHKVLPFFVKKKPKIPMYHGAQWWLLTKNAIDFVAKEFKNNEEWNNFMSSGFLTDEAYIPSLIMSSALAINVAGKNVTYADWRNPTGPHPKTLLISDLEDILSSSCLFARKLDMDLDPKILDTLDNNAL